MRNLTIREFVFFSLVAAFDKFSSDRQKKDGQKIYIQTEKLISQVYNKNHNLIVEHHSVYIRSVTVTDEVTPLINF